MEDLTEIRMHSEIDLPLKHKELLLSAGFDRYLNNLYNCVSDNNSVLQDILQSSELQEVELEDVNKGKCSKY